MTRFIAMAILILSWSRTGAADESGTKESPRPKLKAVEVKAAWGPEKGPDGKAKSSVIAVIPQDIMDVILADMKTWYGKELDVKARDALLKKVAKKIGGRGPSAWFTRRRNEDGDVFTSKPQASTKYELMGGREAGFEMGTWQPPLAKPAKPVKDGYRWQLTWMTQVGFGKERRRYRVDVDLTGTVDMIDGKIKYKAVWKGPFAEPPVDIGKVPQQQRGDAK